MTWEIVDNDDPLGPTRYVAESGLMPSKRWMVTVIVRREGCASWWLGTYEDLRGAQAGIAAFRAERTRIRTEQQQQREGQAE